MLMSICGVCGRKKPLGKICECQKNRHRYYDSERRDKESAAFYHSPQWVRMQKAIKARAGGCDEYIKATEGRMIPGSIVHHIEPLKEDPDDRLNTENLILVSPKTHRMIHDRYAMGRNEKTAMQDALKKAVHRSHFWE